MWRVSGNDIYMTVGDYGIELPITVSGATFDTADTLLIVIKTGISGDTLLEKTYEDIENNTIRLVLTDEESAALGVGNYVYRLDWYQDDEFLCNIIPYAKFKVVTRA